LVTRVTFALGFSMLDRYDTSEDRPVHHAAEEGQRASAAAI
jgi:hypothetical protein